MDELNPSRMQMNGCVVIGSPGSVFDVTFDGAAETGQCSANLMVTPRFGLHLDKGVMVRTPDRAIGQFRLFLGDRQYVFCISRSRNMLVSRDKALVVRA